MYVHIHVYIVYGCKGKHEHLLGAIGAISQEIHQMAHENWHIHQDFNHGQDNPKLCSKCRHVYVSISHLSIFNTALKPLYCC